MYEMGVVLGNGAFSVVQRARHKDTKESVAIKVFN
jgi:serine/threonine protein kinase